MAIEITNEEIDQILDEYNEEIEETDRNLLGLIALGIAYDIAIFAVRVERAVQTFRAAGVSEQSIFGILSEDLSNHGSIFGGLRNSIVRGIVFGNNQFSRIGQIGVYGDSVESFRWVTIKGHRICDDCQGREGEVDTLDGWIERGMPGSGWSVCGGYCYCILVPVDFQTSGTIEVKGTPIS